MNTTDSLIQVMDTVKNIVDTTSKNISHGNSYEWAYWLGGFLAVGIIALGLLKQQTSEKEKLKQKMKTGEVDFNGVISSAFHSQELYDMLKKKCHPDRFSNCPQLIDKATEIFSLISKNKYNHKALLKLKERAEKELKIDF